jgi:uncharacterized membrane protein
LPIDPAAQWRCIAADPLRFARLVATHLATHAPDYAESLAGRLGWNDLKLPGTVIVLELVVLLASGLTSPTDLPARSRAVFLAVAVLTVYAALAGVYATWSVVCSSSIEGFQGRYFLPLAVLVLSTLAWRPLRWRVSAPVLIIAALAANAVALLAVSRSAW